ncbi:hypothetical protein OF820_13625 [Oceanotoga sp. DSM 15011]|jgi:flagellar FliL protein|uniref:Flagellar protein FliL n=1 Tax=Oceanotoga teriensis TaxID=515440 RepID=A0AA45C8R7_9BACT|nr:MULTISPECIES: flagellar basal body-associated FliL family protein [Oceanotoga]MDN5342105.1 flagellar protein FliL [Oceanotoga sp.]MDO7975425.1 hypothetical protein [Oceanotoga teriensis]PWJ96287.1 flagellar FliL protein [Oceanotoga teriensis]UYP00071.1 hypothetical protein OF820_13625 [Oceanotoga sp. DSM 15011]
MADEDNIQVPETKEKKGPNLIMILIITVVVTLIVAAGTSFLIIKLLSPNVQENADVSNSSSLSTQIISTSELIREGARYPVMLKGGKDVAVIDALNMKVGSNEARDLLASNKIEVLEAVRMIFLNKTRSEVSNSQGIELIKKQIKDSVNEIIGFTGERENLGVVKVIMVILTVSSTE